MKQLIIPTDVRSANGRIYPHELIQKLAPTLANIVGKLGSTEEDETRGKGFGGSAFVASQFEAQPDGLHADIRVLDTPEGRTLQLRMAQTVFRPVGAGKLNKTGASVTVSEFDLTGIVAIPAKDDAFVDVLRPATDDIIQLFRLLDLAKLRKTVDALGSDQRRTLTNLLKSCQRDAQG